MGIQEDSLCITSDPMLDHWHQQLKGEERTDPVEEPLSTI